MDSNTDQAAATAKKALVRRIDFVMVGVLAVAMVAWLVGLLGGWSEWQRNALVYGLGAVTVGVLMRVVAAGSRIRPE